MTQKFQIKIAVLLLLLSSTSLFSMEESLKRSHENDSDSNFEMRKRRITKLSIDTSLCAAEGGAASW